MVSHQCQKASRRSLRLHRRGGVAGEFLRGANSTAAPATRRRASRCRETYGPVGGKLLITRRRTKTPQRGMRWTHEETRAGERDGLLGFGTEWWDLPPNRERGTLAGLKINSHTAVPAGPKVVAFPGVDVGRDDLIRRLPETRGAPAGARAPRVVGRSGVTVSRCRRPLGPVAMRSRGGRRHHRSEPLSSFSTVAMPAAWAFASVG